MSPNINGLPVPDFQDEAQNITKNEILELIEKSKIKYNPQFIGGVTSFVPTYIDFGAVLSYQQKNDRATVLRSIKTNFNNIIKQVDASLEKMDNLNKENVQKYLTRIVITNVPGKASTSKKATYYPDGTLEVGTCFEDSINCSYYLEKKVIQALNEFRPVANQVVPDKVAAFVAPVSQPVAAVTSTSVTSSINNNNNNVSSQPQQQSTPAPPTPSVGGGIMDLSQPNYANGVWETLKLEILALVKPFSVDATVLGMPFEMPLYIDWGSIALSGADPSNVLKSIKNNMNSISKQIVPGIAKVDAVRKPMIRDFLVSVVLQNVAGKASTSKKVFLTVEGCLVVVLPFEDSINCSYYLEKKITQGLNEFTPPAGSGAPAKYVPPPQPIASPEPVVQQPAVPQKPAMPSYGIPDSYRQVSQPAYVPQTVAVPVQPVAAPVVPVIPQAAPVVYQEPKEKGRVEMEWRPQIEDVANQHLLREIEAILKSFTLVDDSDQPIGAPIYIDFQSIMCYSVQVKQNTVLRNVNLAIFRLIREVHSAVKTACTDYAQRENIKTYLRSVTIQNIQGTSTGAKKVVYEDGHMTVQTIFEDFGNCCLYFDSKVIQAFSARPSIPNKKPEQLIVTKEEVAVRINAHKDYKAKDGKPLATGCPVEVDWATLSAKGYEGTSIENNVIGVQSAIFADMFLAFQSFTREEVDILRKEIVKVVFVQPAFGKSIFDKRTVVTADSGVMTISTTFEDRTEGGKTFKERFVASMRSRLYKVEIRDVLVPAIKGMIEKIVRTQQMKPNRLDKIEVPPANGYTCNVVFDWQLIEKETPEIQVATYKSVVDNLTLNGQFARTLEQSLLDVNSYDVGKKAFLPTTQFFLRHIMRAKEETLKFNDASKVWEFLLSYHDPANIKTNKTTLTTFIKEKLNVAFPCAVQDTFPQVDEIQQRLQTNTGKLVPITIEYDVFRKFTQFANDPYSYKSIEGIVVDVPAAGLEAISTLCKDTIVATEYKNKVKSITITYDLADGQKKLRKTTDSNVGVSLDAAGLLKFTINFSEARNNIKMLPWAYPLESVLGTRPLKVQRAIERAKQDLVDVSGSLGRLIGKTVTVSVDYPSFISHPEYLIELEETNYCKIIASFSNALNVGWINSKQSSELSTYDTVKASIQKQLNTLTFKIDPLSRQSSSYDFKLNGSDLIVTLNLDSAKKYETKDWRIDLDRVLTLRDLKIQEEISRRVSFKENQDALTKVIGKPITITVDWQSLLKEDFFVKNVDDYISYIHLFSEALPEEFAELHGFGEVCEYSEVQAQVQKQINTIRLIASSSEQRCSFYQNGTTLECTAGIKGIRKFLKDAEGDYEMYGRKIENALKVRLMIVRGYISRKQNRYLNEAKNRVREGVEIEVDIKFDWESIVQHPSFLAIVDYKPILENMIEMASHLHSIIQLCRENPNAKKILNSVRTYTIKYDGDNRIDEAEFAENKFGVNWVRAAFFAPPTKDHILITCNLQPMKNHPHQIGLEDKIEFLVTPNLAEERYQKKLARQDREEDLQWRRAQDAKDESWRSEQRRMDNQMLAQQKENNRQLDRLNRKLRW